MLPDCTRDPEGLALLTACKENPLDPAPRLILSDWLEDHGEDDVARCLRESMAGDGCMVPLPTRAQERWQPLNGCDHGWLCLRPVAETVERKLDELRDCPWFGAVSFDWLSYETVRRMIEITRPLSHVVKLELDSGWLRGGTFEDDSLACLSHLSLHSNLVDQHDLAMLCRDKRVRRLTALNLAEASLTFDGLTELYEPVWRRSLRSLRLKMSFHARREQGVACLPLSDLDRLELTEGRVGDEVLQALADREWANLRSLALRYMNVSDIPLQHALAACPPGRLTTLDLSGNALGDFGLQALAAWPGMGRLEQLRLNWVYAGSAGFAALAASPQADCLRRLDMSDNRWLDEDLMAGSSRADFPGLTELALNECDLRADSFSNLARSPMMARLSKIRLSKNRLEVAGVQQLARSARALTHLDVSANFIGDAGVKHLADAEGVRRICELNLADNGIAAPGVAQLASSPNMPDLSALTLSRNPITDNGLRVLANSRILTGLRTLHASQVGATDAGLRALLDSPHLGPLESLNLWGNQITDAGADVLANCEALDTLTDLYISEEHLTDTGKAALRNSPHLRHTIIHW